MAQPSIATSVSPPSSAARAAARQRSLETPPINNNIVILRGVLAAAPEPRTTPNGVVSEATLRVQTCVDGANVREQVPLVWIGEPDRFASAIGGESIVARGRVRQRFFRSGPATVSRTEVVVEDLVAVRRRRRAQSLVDSASLDASFLVERT